jgi:hypothetical protein
MVNAGMVNGAPPYFSPATFCESFPVFARILPFQNPFKYIRRLAINHKTAHPQPSGGARQVEIILCFQ